VHVHVLVPGPNESGLACEQRASSLFGDAGPRFSVCRRKRNNDRGPGLEIVVGSLV